MEEVADVMTLCIVQAEAISGYAICEKERIESERLETLEQSKRT